MLEFNTKVMGGQNNLGYDGKALGYERKEATWHHNVAAGAWYKYEDDPAPTTPAPTTPAAPSWDDPVLRRAKEAGAAAEAANPMRRTRRPDGKFGCGHCVKCNYGRPDRCDQPVELVVAKSIADATFGAAIAKAEADAAKMQHVVYLEERRREQVL